MTDCQKSPARRLAVFGGSFDPVHNGHIETAEAALRHCALDRVLFIPARIPPHKSITPHATGDDRLAMVRLAIAGRPAFSASDIELRRTGKSYSIDTVRELLAEMNTKHDDTEERSALFFIVGSDALAELPLWKDITELARLCTFIVVARPGWPLDALDALAPLFPSGRLAATKSLAVHSTANPVSSTEIRSRLAAGRPVRGLVPDPVADYIARNKLYTRP